MNDYCDAALDYLSHAYDPQRALFSWRSRVGAGGEVIHDWDPPWSLRYTINTYLGLSEAERHGGTIEWLGEVRTRLGQFLASCEAGIENSGDHGLLLVLLAATDPSHPAAGRSLARLEDAVSREGAAGSLNMQELAWMLWGATAWAADARAEALARRIFDLIQGGFVDPASRMPRHSRRRYRAHTVSFGSVVYFLRAMHEYGEAFDSSQARDLFDGCLARVLKLQGADGAWPWMLDVRTAVPIDIYPIFSVHQDSMAMLFLFPARDRGVAGAEAAIQRSFLWNLGSNQLGASLLCDTPYPWFYRSIERQERWPRARRYLRGLGRPASRYPPPSSHVRLNRECRSYHPGWVLYAWSAHAETPVLASVTGDGGLVAGGEPGAVR